MSPFPRSQVRGYPRRLAPVPPRMGVSHFIEQHAESLTKVQKDAMVLSRATKGEKMSNINKWTLYKISWTRRENHPAVGDYEGGVYLNYIEAPNATTAREWFMKSDLVFAVKRVQKVDTMARLKEMAYEKARA